MELADNWSTSYGTHWIGFLIVNTSYTRDYILALEQPLFSL